MVFGGVNYFRWIPITVWLNFTYTKILRLFMFNLSTPKHHKPHAIPVLVWTMPDAAVLQIFIMGLQNVNDLGYRT